MFWTDGQIYSVILRAHVHTRPLRGVTGIVSVHLSIFSINVLYRMVIFPHSWTDTDRSPFGPVIFQYRFSIGIKPDAQAKCPIAALGWDIFFVEHLGKFLR